MDDMLPPAPKKSALPYVLIVGAVVLVCLCCCAALAGFFVLSKASEEDQAVSDQSTMSELDNAVDELSEALQQSTGEDASHPRTLTYELEQRVRLMNSGENPAKPVKLWVALIQDLPPYQLVHSLQTDPLKYEIITDEYDNQYALFTIQQLNAGEETLVTLRYKVELAQIQANLDDCQGSLPDTDIYPEKYVESDAPKMIELANELSAGRQNACEISRAIYDYVADNMKYTTYNPDDLGALAALE